MTALRAQTTAVRKSTDLAAARPKDIAAAQRALDVQDGRVLHVMGLVLRGFRRARRQHRTMLLPVLGDLGRVFNVARHGGSDDHEPA